VSTSKKQSTILSDEQLQEKLVPTNTLGLSPTVTTKLVLV